MQDIIIVSCRKKTEVARLIHEIRIFTPQPHRVIFTGFNVSASMNRNFGLNQVKSDIFVMMDDDISLEKTNWLPSLIEPLSDDNVILSSARMIDENGNTGGQMGALCPNDDFGVYDVAQSSYKGYRRVMTACFAMRRTYLRFDEGFKGSGYEDTAFMNEVNKEYPGKRLVITNKCKVVHQNKMLNQGGAYFEHNKRHYLSLYPDDLSVINQNDWTKHA